MILQKSSDSSADDLIKRTLVYALENMEAKKSYALLKRIFKEKTYVELKSGKLTLAAMDLKDLGLDGGEFERAVKSLPIDTTLERHREFLVTSTPFKQSNDRGLFANGWVYYAQIV